jgi:hypothetical protein
MHNMSSSHANRSSAPLSERSSYALQRRQFLHAGASAALSTALLGTAAHGSQPVELPAEHRLALKQRRRRIVVQQDAYDALMRYGRLHSGSGASFARFRDAMFSYADEPESQIDAIWWDISGSPFGAPYPSKVLPAPDHPLVQQWRRDGVDWVGELVNETRRRKLEVVWNHRISEVEIQPEGGLTKRPHPLKVEHPDWVVAASWWPQGMWNLEAEGLREYKVAILRELATRYDLDGMQIDFSRHIPCLPVGRQWELREQVTQFMRMVREMLLEVAHERRRPLLLAAKVPQNLQGCAADGFDVRTWAELRLVDVLTLGSRSMDVGVEGIRAAVGDDVQLQPCFDDHHATDGYRYGPIEFLRGVFAIHLQRGANSVVTFNWSIGGPEVAKSIGGEIGPLAHQVAYKEVGSLQTMAGKDKFFAVERRGGYPWADGFFNRNDTAPLPLQLSDDGQIVKLTLHISESPAAAKENLVLRYILFQANEDDTFEFRLNGVALPVITRDPQWKDAQIFSPKPQPTSGYKPLPINPQQRLLRLDCAVSRNVWRQGPNEVEIRLAARGPAAPKSVVQLEKVEAHSTKSLSR